MRIRQITLRDVRSLREAGIDLTDPDTGEPLLAAALFGPNGSGKSTVLGAVSALLGQAFPPYGADPLSDADVRRGCDRGSVSLRWDDPPLPGAAGHARLAATMALGGDPTGAPQDLHLDEGSTAAFARWKAALREDHPRHGLIVRFDPFRGAPSPPLGTLPPAVRRHPLAGALDPSFRRQGGFTDPTRFLKEGIVQLWVRHLAENGAGHFRAVIEALDRLLHPVRFSRVDPRSYEIWFETPSGPVPLDVLADGHRGLFAVVAGLLLRLSMACGDDEDPAGVEAVALVDEIDAHLHPRWQARVMNDLRRAFPRVQWIVTTHSPEVTGSLREAEIYRLEGEP